MTSQTFAAALAEMTTGTLGGITPDTDTFPGVEVRDLVWDGPHGLCIEHLLLQGRQGGKIIRRIQHGENTTVYVISGLLTVTIAGQEHPAQPGSFFNIPPGTAHGFVPCLQGNGEVQLLVIQTPAQ